MTTPPSDQNPKKNSTSVVNNKHKDTKKKHESLVTIMRERFQAVSSSSSPSLPTEKAVEDNGDSSNNNDKDDYSPRVWESLWKDAIIPWDLGGPTEVLLSELNAQLQPSQQWIPPKTSLIPGCGSGYDVISLARYLDGRLSDIITKESDDHHDESTYNHSTYTVIGLEVSPTSLEEAFRTTQRSLDQDGPLHHTTIHLCYGNFFRSPSTWNITYTITPTSSTSSSILSSSNEQSSRENDDTTSIGRDKGLLPSSSSTETRRLSVPQSYDFIFDYTFFCAISPDSRSQWGEHMASLLTPDRGKLLTLMFPYEHPRASSPPPSPHIPILPHHDNTNDDDDEPSSFRRETMMMAMEEQEKKRNQGPPYWSSIDSYRKVLEPWGVVMETLMPYESPSTVPQRRGQEVVGWWSNSHKARNGDVVVCQAKL